MSGCAAWPRKAVAAKDGLRREKRRRLQGLGAPPQARRPQSRARRLTTPSPAGGAGEGGGANEAQPAGREPGGGPPRVPRGQPHGGRTPAGAGGVHGRAHEGPCSGASSVALPIQLAGATRYRHRLAVPWPRPFAAVAGEFGRRAALLCGRAVRSALPHGVAGHGDLLEPRGRGRRA